MNQKKGQHGTPFDFEINKNRMNLKKIAKAFFIFRAVENGWTVKKSDKIKNSFEFTSHRAISKIDDHVEDFVDSESERRRSVSEPLRLTF